MNLAGASNKQAELHMRILVIDDERIVRRPICRFLRRHDFDVMEAVDGRDGLSKFRTWHPDVVVTDLMMPNIDGLHLIRVLSRCRPQLPIIAVSAGLRPDDGDALRLAKNTGATETLLKPFRLLDLLDRVQRAVARGRTGRERPLPTREGLHGRSHRPCAATTGPCCSSRPKARGAEGPHLSEAAPPRSRRATGRKPSDHLEVAG